MKKVAVIIATHNRPRQLADCLTSLANQNLPKEDFEVVVVDDGSQPKLDRSSLYSGKGLDLKLIYQSNKGPAEARNAGARSSAGKYLLFTDDDCAPEPDWAQKVVEQLDQTPHQAVGGKTINALKENPFAEASQMLVTYLYSYYNENGSKPRFFASNNLGLSKKDFFEVGGFSTNFTSHYSEDRDFCDKWNRSNREMKYLPDAIVAHRHQMGFGSFWRQHFRYGKGARQYHLERELRDQPMPKIEPMSFYTNMLAFPYRTEKFVRATLLATLIGITQLAHTCGYVWQRFVLAKD